MMMMALCLSVLLVAPTWEAIPTAFTALQGDCTDLTSTATKITSTTTLGDYSFGWTVNVKQGKYCTHDFIYNFRITYALGTSDANSNFFMRDKALVEASGVCKQDTISAITTWGTLSNDTV